MMSKKEQKKVILKYYDDRNWNLIILRRNKEAKNDLKELFKNYFINKTLFVCLYRIVFSKRIVNKDIKFNKEVLLGDVNEKR